MCCQFIKFLTHTALIVFRAVFKSIRAIYRLPPFRFIFKAVLLIGSKTLNEDFELLLLMQSISFKAKLPL